LCEFFSFVSDGKKFYYFNWQQRKKILKGKLNYQADSHTSIADFYGFKADKEDKLNKFEYNPLTKVFKIDQINIADNSKEAKKWVKKLDFKKVVEPLIIKPIINPLTDIVAKEVTSKEILLLKKWASVRASVWDSVRDSVWASVWDSVRDSVWASVGDSVRDSVWASVWDSVRDSVWASVRASVRDSVRDSVWASVGDSVRDSVWASVGDSVWAYSSKYFKIKFKFSFKCSTDLWSKGFVASFFNGSWHLHAGKDAKIVFSITKEDLLKYK
jgi:hypothetical protein